MNLTVGRDACTKAVFAADAPLALVQVKLFMGHSFNLEHFIDLHLTIQSNIFYWVLVDPQSPHSHPRDLHAGVWCTPELGCRE